MAVIGSSGDRPCATAVTMSRSVTIETRQPGSPTSSDETFASRSWRAPSRTVASGATTTGGRSPQSRNRVMVAIVLVMVRACATGGRRDRADGHRGARCWSPTAGVTGPSSALGRAPVASGTMAADLPAAAPLGAPPAVVAVGVDGSEESLRAVMWALALARALAARLVLVHGTGLLEGAGLQPAVDLDHQLASALARLGPGGDAGAASARPAPDVRLRRRPGDSVDVLLAVAAEE